MKLDSASMKYSAKNKIFSIDMLAKPGEISEHVAVKVRESEHRLLITLEPREEVVIQELLLSYHYEFTPEQRVFLNGYQSWTESVERKINSSMPGLTNVSRRIVNWQHLDACGDYSFVNYQNKQGILHGVSYGYVREGKNHFLFGSRSERSGFTLFELDTVANRIFVRKDCKGLTITRPYTPFDLIFLEGTEKEVFDTFFSQLIIHKSKPTPLTGYTTWYRHLEDISEKKLSADLKSISESPIDFNVFCIEEGYQSKIGDWLVVNKVKFPNGIAEMAKKISKAELIPGIWMTPFICERKSEIFRKHSDWLLHDGKGAPVLVTNNWHKAYALDFYVPACRQYIKNVIQKYALEYGFGFFKFDFLFAAAMIPRPDKTRAEIMYEAIEFLRECAGDVIITACGVPLAPAFGKVDFCQIGPDLTPNYRPSRILKKDNRESASTQALILNNIYRRELGRRAFGINPNIITFNNPAFLLKDEEKKNLATIAALSGGLLFTSDDVSKYTNDDEKTWERLIALRDANVLKAYSEDHDVHLRYEYNTNRINIVIPFFD